MQTPPAAPRPRSPAVPPRPRAPAGGAAARTSRDGVMGFAGVLAARSRDGRLEPPAMASAKAPGQTTPLSTVTEKAGDAQALARDRLERDRQNEPGDQDKRERDDLFSSHRVGDAAASWLSGMGTSAHPAGPATANAPAPGVLQQRLDQHFARVAFEMSQRGGQSTAVVVPRLGPAAGQDVVLRAQGRTVRISVADVGAAAWGERICARLRERGLDAEVEVG